MANPSSTSSSERKGVKAWPWALLIAALTIWIVDGLALGVDGPWPWLMKHSPPRGGQRGVVMERLSQKEIRDRPAETRGVFVAGSSRALHGFDRNALGLDTERGLMVAQVGRPSMGPFEIHSATADLLRMNPDAVVIFASEFDTHRPIQVVPNRSSGNVTAIVSLMNDIGPGNLWRQRHDIYRLFLVEALHSYRYRDVLGHTILNRFRRFRVDDERFPKGKKPRAGSLNIGATTGKDYRAAQNATYRRLLPQLPEDSVRFRAQVRQIYNIRPGTHVEIQQRQLRRAVEALSRGGVMVLVVEAPLHPLAVEIYDTSLRQEFLDFARALETLPGVTFLPLELHEPFTAEDFMDLTHLNRDGAARFTAPILDRLTAPSADASS